jgi:hypothetical protein
MKNKKAQMQMMETIGVLFVFIIIIAMGFIFYANVLKGGIEITKREHSELQAVELSTRAASLPELQCSEDNIVQENCIDLIKLEVAGSVMQQNYLTYFDLFGYSEITVKEIFPNANNYTIYSNIPSDYKQKLPNFVPIALKDPGRGQAFGIMNVVLYTK